MQALFKTPTGIDQEAYRFKIKPYQCESCGEIFHRLNSFHLHNKMYPARCPTTAEMRENNLDTNEQGYWIVVTPKVFETIDEDGEIFGTCFKCSETKPLEDFPRTKYGVRQKQCKACFQQLQQERFNERKAARQADKAAA
jgi:hypothetical protein